MVLMVVHCCPEILNGLFVEICWLFTPSGSNMILLWKKYFSLKCFWNSIEKPFFLSFFLSFIGESTPNYRGAAHAKVPGRGTYKCRFHAHQFDACACPSRGAGLIFANSADGGNRQAWPMWGTRRQHTALHSTRNIHTYTATHTRTHTYR